MGARLLRLLVALSLLVVGAVLLRPADAETFTTIGCTTQELVAAVEAAGTNGDDDAILLAPGCRYPLEAPVVVRADGGFRTALRVPDGQDAAVLDGQGLTQILRAEAGSRLELQGVRLLGGRPRTVGALSVGGAVEALGSLATDDVVVSGTRPGEPGTPTGAAVYVAGGAPAAPDDVPRQRPGAGQRAARRRLRYGLARSTAPSRPAARRRPRWTSRGSCGWCR